jgi:two-component system sensor histidine kinase UhpB
MQLDLPRLVMRRAGSVAAAVLLLALGLGLARMGADIDDEVDAAVTLAQWMAKLTAAAPLDDAAALGELRKLLADHPPRHLLLSVQDGDGRLLLVPPAPQPTTALDGLLALHRRLLSAPDARQVSWDLLRPGGARWTVTLTASHESERREAMVNLVGTLALLLACIAGLLLAMRWNLRRALAPLDRLLAAIDGIEGHDAQAVQALPAMPVRELETLASALRHLGGALDAAQAQRRLLSQQVLTLQEDERARLARELHDEFGQRLTALRLDAVWLSHQVAGQPLLMPVVEGMARQCALVQQDIRSLLSRLQPFGHDDDAHSESLLRLVSLLRALVASWIQPGRGQATVCRLDLRWLDSDGQPIAWPNDDAAEDLRLTGSLALAIYRISQEALTNVARHAQASVATLALSCRGDTRPGAPLRIDWSASDDGVGLIDAEAVSQRGKGISGIQARVWAQGGELCCEPLQAGSANPGLRLSASFRSTWCTKSVLREAHP